MSNINREICKYISNEWISTYESNRSFALDHDIDEKMVRKILDEDEYRIPVETLKKICDAREISLSEFFERIEQ